jgi:hypothetical protein
LQIEIGSQAYCRHKEIAQRRLREKNEERRENIGREKREERRKKREK